MDVACTLSIRSIPHCQSDAVASCEEFSIEAKGQSLHQSSFGAESFQASLGLILTSA